MRRILVFFLAAILLTPLSASAEAPSTGQASRLSEVTQSRARSPQLNAAPSARSLVAKTRRTPAQSQTFETVRIKLPSLTATMMTPPPPEEAVEHEWQTVRIKLPSLNATMMTPPPAQEEEVVEQQWKTVRIKLQSLHATMKSPVTVDGPVRATRSPIRRK